MNVSPGEYLLNLRFNEACKLLKQTSLSVQAVAEGVGMAPNAFFKLFKSRMNMTPGAYRTEGLLRFILFRRVPIRAFRLRDGIFPRRSP